MAQNRGMQDIYEGLQNDNLEKKEAEIVETINTILKNESDTSKINRKTRLTDSYAMPTMDSIADYLDAKYKKDADIPVKVIRTWSKYHKDVSVSIGGWLITSILDTFKGFVEMIKQRSLGDRLLGKNTENKD